MLVKHRNAPLMLHIIGIFILYAFTLCKGIRSAFVDDAYLDYNSFESRFKFHCSVQDNMRPAQSETLDIF